MSVREDRREDRREEEKEEGADTALKTLDDGWPESEKDVFQAALSMVVVKNSR